MTLKEITADLNEDEQALMDAVIAAVAEKGEDYVYSSSPEEQDVFHGESCLYLKYDVDVEDGLAAHPTGEGSCIVGCALISVGMSLDALQHWEMNSAETILGYVSEESDDYYYRPEFIDAVNQMQEKQDAGTAWGEAANHAISLINANL